MKIAVLSRNRHLYSTRRLVEEGINRGHEVKVIDCLHCSMNITSANPQIHYHEPVVIKLLQGTQGIGVVLAETRKAAESVIEAFMGLKADILVQEFIKEAGGADIRCFVIGDKVIAAMKRQGAEGEFRSNLHRGGTASLIRITPQERSTAIKAAKAMGLNVAGVDLLRSSRGPLVMEVNSSPGLEGIENATGKNVAGMIINWTEKNQKPWKTRTKGRG